MMSLLCRTACVACCVIFASCVRHEAAAPAPSAATPPAVRYQAHISAGGQLPLGATPDNPVRSDPQAPKAGEMLFTAMNCDGCHGGGGSGWVGPNLADGRWRYGGADSEIFSSIYYGRPKGMPAFGGALGPTGVWNIVAYLKSLPVPAGEATESWEQ